MSSVDSPSQSELLDKEIASLKERVATLRKTLKIECSTILSSPLTQSLFQQPSEQSTPTPSATTPKDKLAARSSQQKAYLQQCLYRISTSVTAFKVLDPDPNAVDAGHVLGLRFEVMSRGQFLRPYYVMLNRPFFQSKHLRVHRHTLPPAVPLSGLAARHLPAPRPESQQPPVQDLDRFVRTLRREIARYHNRLGVSADLRRSLGPQNTAAEVTENTIVDVGIADLQAKQINLTWADERTGRLVMDDDGNVVKLMVFAGDGRDWETTGELLGTDKRIEDVAKKLTEYSAG